MLRQEAQSFKGKRDELNSEVHLLKTMNEERRKQIRGKIDLVKEDTFKIQVTLEDKPSRSFKSLKDELDKVEWKIQTELNSIEEEKNLVERVKSLENQLEAYKRLEAIRSRIVKNDKDANALRLDLSSDREKIRELATQSQSFHEKMIERLERAKKLKTEADKMHGKYVEFKEKARVQHTKSQKVFTQIKILREEIWKKEKIEKAEQEANLRDQLEKRALEKLKNGKKLTFEEFQILVEQGKI